MTRIICSILAAGTAALAMSSPARADEYRERYEEHAPAPIARRYDEGMRWRDRDYDRDDYRGGRWRELQRERRQFYSFRHSRAECARFERWYAWRLERLRFRGW